MADLSQDGDEWSSFDHIVEMKHCVFIPIGTIAGTGNAQFALALKKKTLNSRSVKQFIIFKNVSIINHLISY